MIVRTSALALLAHVAFGATVLMNTPEPFISPEPIIGMESPEPIVTAIPIPRNVYGCGSTSLFCEDFESTPTKPWRLEGDAALVDIPTHARFGTRVLQLNPVGGKFGRLVLDNFRPPRNSFFGRLFVRVEEFPTEPNYSHWVITEVLGVNGTGENVRPLNGQLIQEVNNRTNMWGVGSDKGLTGDWTAWKESAPAVEKKWVCVEWQMENSDSSVRVWLDSVSKPELEVSKHNHGGNKTMDFVFPQFDSIWFGFWNFQSGTTPNRFNVLIDSIVLDSIRVGC